MTEYIEFLENLRKRLLIRLRSTDALVVRMGGGWCQWWVLVFAELNIRVLFLQCYSR
jgi:hypothetical protein